jgi:hypothetical protein
MLKPFACRSCMVTLIIAALAIAIKSPLAVSQPSASPMLLSHTEETSKLVLDIEWSSMSILRDSHCAEPMVGGATHGTMVAQQLLRRGDVCAVYRLLDER